MTKSQSRSVDSPKFKRRISDKSIKSSSSVMLRRKRGRVGGAIDFVAIGDAQCGRRYGIRWSLDKTEGKQRGKRCFKRRRSNNALVYKELPFTPSRDYIRAFL